MDSLWAEIAVSCRRNLNHEFKDQRSKINCFPDGPTSCRSRRTPRRTSGWMRWEEDVEIKDQSPKINILDSVGGVLHVMAISGGYLMRLLHTGHFGIRDLLRSLSFIFLNISSVISVLEWKPWRHCRKFWIKDQRSTSNSRTSSTSRPSFSSTTCRPRWPISCRYSVGGYTVWGR